jgi:hypothetical protein
MLEPVASRAVPEGLSQIIGYHTLFYHIFSPMLEVSRAAF